MKKLRFILPLTLAALAIALAPAVSFGADGDKQPEKKEGPSRGGERGGQRGERGQRGPQLTKEEQEKLTAALAKVKDNAEVVAARKAVQDAREGARKAEGAEARKAAVTKTQDAQKKLIEVTKAAVLKADPSVEPILKKAGDRALSGARQGAPAGREGTQREAGRRRGGQEKPAEKSE